MLTDGLKGKPNRWTPKNLHRQPSQASKLKGTMKLTRSFFFFSWRQGVWPPTFSGNILNLDLMFMGHVAKDGEDGKPRNKTGHTVDGAGQQGIPGRERERLLLAMQVPLTPPPLCSRTTGHLWNLQSHPVSKKATLSFHCPAVTWTPVPHHH